MDLVKEYAAAEKKNEVTAEQIDNCLASGEESLMAQTEFGYRLLVYGACHVSYRRGGQDMDNPNGIEDDDDDDEDFGFSKLARPMPEAKDRHRLAATYLDNLYETYILPEISNQQYRSAATLLQLYFRMFADWISSTPIDIGRIDTFGPEFGVGRLLKSHQTLRRRLRDEHLPYLGAFKFTSTETVISFFAYRTMTYVLALLSEQRGKYYKKMRDLRQMEAARNFRVAKSLYLKAMAEPTRRMLNQNTAMQIEVRCTVAETFDPNKSIYPCFRELTKIKHLQQYPPDKDN